jgi:Right handed beta helix region
MLTLSRSDSVKPWKDSVNRTTRLASVAALAALALVGTAQTASAAPVTAAPAASVVAAPTATKVVGSSRYENTSSAVALSGNWAQAKHSSDSGGSSANAKVAGNSAQLSFKATGVKWVARTGPSLGVAQVYLDGVRVATVDQYSSTQKFQQTLYSNTSLTKGEHTLKIVRTGTKSAASRGNDISVDALVVTDGAAPAAPKSVKSTVQREGVRITWAKSSSGDVKGYRVYRATGGGNFQKISGSSLVKGLNYLDIGLTGGKKYRFAVAAVDTSGNVSAKSKLVSVTQPKTAPVKSRVFNCPKGGKSVSNIAQLRKAVAAAKPGTVIRLKPGVYKGGIIVTKSGTAAKPIWICGSSRSVLDHSNIRDNSGVKIEKASHVNIAGFTIQSFRKGVVLSGASHISVSDLVIRNIGEEGVKLRYGTTDSMIVKNTIQNTGRVVAQYGEGIYIGSSPKDWCAVYNCKTDKSDRNSVVANSISGTTADPIEAKPGTSGGVIRNNTIDGKSLVAVDHLMAVKGKNYLVTDNVAVNGRSTRGITSTYTEVAGYGTGNVFARNRVSVPKGATAVYVGEGNIVDCSNSAPVAGSLRSNVPCQN